METWEWDQVDSELTEIGVELSWETDGAGDTAHSSRDEMVEITIGWGGELKGTEADVIKSLVINDHDFVSVLDELMDREGSVVWLNDSVRDLRAWEHGEGFHDSVWVFLTDLRDEEGSHTRASSTTKRVADLEALETITSLSFLTDNIEDGVDEFSTFGVMSLGPIVTGTSLSEDEVVWTEELTEWSSTDGIHSAWL